MSPLTNAKLMEMNQQLLKNSMKIEDNLAAGCLYRPSGQSSPGQPEVLSPRPHHPSAT
jgi:hypothetical protein